MMTVSRRHRTRCQAAFLTILPMLEAITERHFHFLGDASTRADAVADVVAVCWAWFSRLWSRGRDARRFPASLAYLAIRHVKCGRRVQGAESSKDVLSPTARLRRGFQLERLELNGNYDEPEWQEALRDNTRSPVPEQACFRVDFPAWLRSLDQRQRRLIKAMLKGEGTGKLARRFGISPGRVSQLRREFHQNWRRFHGELVDNSRASVAA
ncbi:MAG: hypothetical protein AB7K24_16970 [Gemmataceae bacterium]